MRTLARTLAPGLVVSLLLCASGPAFAASYEDSLEECAYPKMFDALVMRPISLAATGVGLVLAVPSSFVPIVSRHDDLGTVWQQLFLKPARFTFVRPLGECQLGRAEL